MIKKLAAMDSTQDPATAKKYLTQRRSVDVSAPFNRYFHYKKYGVDPPIIQPESSYTTDLLQPSAYRQRLTGVVNIPTKFTHLSSNKVKHVIPAIKWTPEGRRLVVGTYSGEFSLWNGSSFTFESLMQAHDSAITSMEYSHAGDWMISGDADGSIKIWQPNFNMVKEITAAHTEVIRDISFSSNDTKFVTCSDDNVLKIWNFTTGKQEKALTGHHWDIKSCHWHPTAALIASASKDNLVRLWDPRAGTCVSSILKFKHTVLKTRFQPGNGNLLLAASKDKSCRVFDIRYSMKELMTVRDDVDFMTLEWHPINESIFTMAYYDGSIKHFDVLQDLEKPVHSIPFAHDKCITALSYNPVGHMLASASKDRTIRFWTRSRPFDPNAFDDPTYNNNKMAGWYFGINNDINAVREKTESGAAPPPSGNSMDSTGSKPVSLVAEDRNTLLPGLSL